MINILVEFLIIFSFCYLFYLFFLILRKNTNKFNKNKIKLEEGYLIAKYKIDFSKFKKKQYKNFLHLTALTNSFIFALTMQLVRIVKGTFFQILISLLFLVPLILISYMIIGKHYQKKGMIKDV